MQETVSAFDTRGDRTVDFEKICKVFVCGATTVSSAVEE
jgi:hypothetical protein